MPILKIPIVQKCCGCVTDLKTATAIIAVLGVVTSPAVSWAVVRHSFVIRVSCFVTTSAARADVVDINLNNILSFGFGANAGLGPSCLGPKNFTKVATFRTEEGEGHDSSYVNTVRWMGWFVLLADIVFLGFSLHFLYKLFRPPERKAAQRFVISCVVAIALSFVYGMLYVGACMSVGGAFPVFEFVFSIIDVITYSMWIYFAIVVRSYLLLTETSEATKGGIDDEQYSTGYQNYFPIYLILKIWERLRSLQLANMMNNIYEYIGRLLIRPR